MSAGSVIRWHGVRARQAISLAALFTVGLLLVAESRALPRERPAIVRAQLENGVRIIVKRNAGASVVAIRATWVGGTAHEPGNQRGAVRLVASAITAGCGKRSATALSRAIDGIGGVISGFAGTSTAGIQAQVMATRWRRGLDLLADCILAPRFDSNVVASARQRLVARLVAGARDPATVAFRTFGATLYPDNPGRVGDQATPGSLAALGASDIARFYENHYSPSAVTIAVVGDVDPAQVIAHVKKRLGSAARPPNTAPANTEDAKPQVQPDHVTEVYRYLETDRAHVIVGYRGLSIADPDRFAMEVLVAILDARLAKETRARPGLAQRAGAISREGATPGFVAAYLSCPPARVSEAASVLRKTLLHAAEDGVSAQEVDRATRYLVGTYRLSLWRSAAQAAALAYRGAHGLGLADTVRYALRVREVNPADVMRVARKLFNAPPVVVTVMPQTMTPAAERRTNGRQPRRRRGES